jgi:hypothetical protein
MSANATARRLLRLGEFREAFRSSDDNSSRLLARAERVDPDVDHGAKAKNGVIA